MGNSNFSKFEFSLKRTMLNILFGSCWFDWVNAYFNTAVGRIDYTPAVSDKYTKGKGVDIKCPMIKGLNKVESICQRACWDLFREKFVKIRPSWLKNPKTNRALELDCYSAKLGIAIEYQGPQHYQHPNYLNQTWEQFEAGRKRDEYKRIVCCKRGIMLIEIPCTVRNGHIKQYIWDRYMEKKNLYEDFFVLPRK